jgi:HEAT repeat protein
MAEPIPFQSIVNVLLDEGKTFPKRYYQHFSDMDPASLKLLLDAWPRVALTRKLSLLDGLESMLEEDTLVSFDDLARALLTDADAGVRARAIRLLEECDDAKLIPAFVKILTKDPDPAARAEAATALGQFVEMGELEEISADAHHRAEDALLHAANLDDSLLVRRRAVESLGFSARTEVPALIESAFQRQDPDWIASAVFAMGRSNDERWAEPVIRMLLSENNVIRLAAAEAAGELGLDAARLPLLRLLEEEDDADVFRAAVWSLSQIGGEDVRTYLVSLLDQFDEDADVEFLEDALANLSFTEEAGRFDLLAFDEDDDLHEVDLKD